MKNIIKSTALLLLAVLFFIPFFVDAYVSVKGYYRSDGTYVRPYVRSNPNGLKYDNYSWTPSQGLYNPTYGTRGATWDTPTYVTDPNYYEGKALYESGVSRSITNSSVNSAPPAPVNAYASGSTWYCNNGYRTIYNNSFQKVGCEKVIAPENAYISGSGWYCNSGYKTIYNDNFQKVSCERVIAPSNAYISGSNWYCNGGYRTIYNNSFQKVGCEKVIAPTNAYVSGSNWYCNSGYRTIYSERYQKTGCEKVIAPANAYVSGSNWYCMNGYKTVYNNSFQKIGCELNP